MNTLQIRGNIPDNIRQSMDSLRNWLNGRHIINTDIQEHIADLERQLPFGMINMPIEMDISVIDHLYNAYTANRDWFWEFEGFSTNPDDQNPKNDITITTYQRLSTQLTDSSSELIQYFESEYGYFVFSSNPNITLQKWQFLGKFFAKSIQINKNINVNLHPIILHYLMVVGLPPYDIWGSDNYNQLLGQLLSDHPKAYNCFKKKYLADTKDVWDALDIDENDKDNCNDRQASSEHGGIKHRPMYSHSDVVPPYVNIPFEHKDDYLASYMKRELLDKYDLQRTAFVFGFQELLSPEDIRKRFGTIDEFSNAITIT